jgi:hypothetical protein
MQVHQKPKTSVRPKIQTLETYNPAMPLLGTYPKECKLTRKRDSCTPMFIAALFTIV